MNSSKNISVIELLGCTRSKESFSLPEQRQGRCVWRSITDLVVFKTVEKIQRAESGIEVGTPEEYFLE
jgi:hypothetical protein